MNYYKSTNDTEKYIDAATRYCEQSLMKIAPDSIVKMDNETFRQFESFQKKTFEGILDSAQLAQTVDYMKHVSRNKYANELNKVAWGFFEQVSDKKALENALRWSKRSLAIYPEKHLYIDTYANLLYKLGQKEAAIAKETDALNAAKENNADTALYEETIKKMQSGAPTWK